MGQSMATASCRVDLAPCLQPAVPAVYPSHPLFIGCCCDGGAVFLLTRPPVLLVHAGGILTPTGLGWTRRPGRTSVVARWAGLG